MSKDQIQNPISLPENLQRQFVLLERRLWKTETASAVCFGLAGAFASFLLLFFSDRVWDSPVWLRAILLFIAIAVCIVGVLFWAKRWIFQRRDWKKLSLLVQKKFRRFGDRLLGIVELAGEGKHNANFSPELYRAAINQVANETERFDFREAVDARPARRTIFAAACLGVLVLLSCFLIPPAGENVLRRWLAPFAAIPRYTLVRLEGLPEKIIVPHGENFSLSARLEFRSFWKPDFAFAAFGKQNRFTAKVSGHEARFEIPAQTQEGILRIQAGDATREILVQPTHRPALKQLAAEIQWPEYLRLPATNQIVNNGVLNLLEGSAFSLRGKISRDLASAESRFGETIENLQTDKDEFSSGILSNSHPPEAGATPSVLQYNFSWRDQLGLSNAAPWKLTIRPQKDLSPLPNLTDLPSDVAMLITDVLEINARAKDDFGVQTLGLSWDLTTDSSPIANGAMTEVKRDAPSPHEKDFGKTFRWSPAIYRVPEDTSVEIIAFAADYFPDRERAESPVHRIHVLGKEKHAEFLRQKLESLLARVEEVARAEEKIRANTGELSENEKLSEVQKNERLEKLAEEQERVAKMLEQMAGEGMKTLQEALKNPVFSEKTLQEWAKNMENMQRLAQKEMKAAAQSLKSAQKNSGKDARKKDLAEAQKKEDETLAALEKMQGKVNQDLDDLQALTLAERLRKVGSLETDIGGELQKIVPETIGMLPSELPEKFRKVGAALAGQQETAQTDSKKLQEEISRFFERTRKPNYGDVNKEIVEARTVDELERVGGLIKENVAMEATKNLGEWAGRFEKWADKLEPPKEESSASSGQPGEKGEKPEDMTKTLVALLRMRAKELSLRSQTQTLEENRAATEAYAERAAALSETQKNIAGDLSKLAGENKVPGLIEPYLQTHETMAQVEMFLRQPLTDKTTWSAQEKSVDSLTDLINLINEQAKRQNSQSQSQSQSEAQSEAEAMAFLTQMMSPQNKPGEAMAMNPKGGGNRFGGTTQRSSEGVNGEVDGTRGESRRVQKASGAAGISLPAEFRETLENYFKAVEQEAN